MKNKFLLIAALLLTLTATAAVVDKFDTITTNSPSKLKVDFLKGINFTSTDSLKIPVGSTGQRDASPANGMLRLNSSNTLPEIYYSAAWRNFLTFTTNVSIPLEMDMNSHKIVNLTDPTSAQDAASKKYVDDTIAAVDLTGYATKAGTQTFSGTNTFSNTIVGSVNGNAATVTTIPSLSGEVSNTGNAVTLSNSSVLGKVLTGFTSGAGTLSSSDSILSAIQKLDGNVAAAGSGTITGPIGVSGGVSSITSQTGTGTKFVVDDSPTLITPNIGVATATSVNGSTIPSSKTLVVTTDKLNALASTSSSELAGVVSDETGTNKLVYSDSPTLVSPALGTPSALVGTNITGTAAGLTAGSVTTIPNLTGEVTSSGLSTTVTNASVIAKTLTGYSSGAGTVSSSDSIVSAIGKLNGNTAAISGDYVSKTATETIAGTKTFSSTIAGSINGNAATVTTNANSTGAITSVGNATSLGSFTSADLSGALTNETGTGSAVFSASPSFSGTPVLADASASSIVIGGTKAASAVLDVQSTTQGAIFPRMTTAQIDAISSPATGLTVFNTDVAQTAVYNGTVWTYGFGNIVASSDWIPCTFSTLAWQGFGTVTNNLKCARYGSVLKIKGKVTLGTTTGSLGQIPLPNNFGTITTDSNYLTNSSLGVWWREQASLSAMYNFLTNPSVSYIQTSTALVAGANNPASPSAGNSANTSDVMAIPEISISIAEWAGTGNSNAWVQSSSGQVIDWTNTTPTTPNSSFAATPSGITIPSNSCQYAKDGPDLLYRCQFTVGTTAASEARISLPIVNGVQLTTPSAMATLQSAGVAWKNVSGTNQKINVLMEPSVSYLTFSGILQTSGSAAPLTKANASSVATSGEYIEFTARIPINGWTSSPFIIGTLAPTAYLKDVKSNGTEGGTSSSGWNTRVLNTVEGATEIISSLSSNQFTLTAGTYKIKARSPVLQGDRGKTRIRNITDSTTSIVGETQYSGGGSAVMITSEVVGQIVITSSKTFELQHYLSTGISTSGLGYSNGGAGEVEVYSTVEIQKIR